MTESVLSAFADGRIRPVADNPWLLLFSWFVLIRVDSWLSTKTKTPSGFAVATVLWAVMNPHVTAH